MQFNEWSGEWGRSKKRASSIPHGAIFISKTDLYKDHEDKKKNHVLDLFKLFWEDFYMLISDMNGSDYSLCGRD